LPEIIREGVTQAFSKPNTGRLVKVRMTGAPAAPPLMNRRRDPSIPAFDAVEPSGFALPSAG
jgi:hypothetical protein